MSEEEKIEYSAEGTKNPIWTLGRKPRNKQYLKIYVEQGMHLFLSRKEGEEYIARNQHHFGKDIVVYCVMIRGSNTLPDLIHKEKKDD